ncbi:polysaccharide biosynthesis tyrosine autokinase [Actinomadura sp. DC4]|uniref:polysaccharide biosynthesis tyrosine autokinase n=1 Tax=Actinomadura sp. DC4 TaxID=3055069 RepID=UPI0025AFCB1C|nr:polysaccharide biosynthesis tyrosine autokinase [Actinomadura sp. DC4]MDN3358950.1 polysaccharide biosynthesis tyrosine autokinase [Actinomadura sp. DC4]
MFSYLRVLRRRWMILIASVLFALISAALVTTRMTPQYAASITLIVSAPEQSGDVSTAYQAVLLSQQRAKSYAALMRSQGVTAGLARRLGDGATAEELQERITAQAVPDTVLLRAVVTDPSAAHAVQVADTLGAEFSRYVDGLERSRPSAHPAVKITVADGAILPTAPVSPRPVRNLGVGLLIGLIVGAIGAVLRDRTDTSVRSARVLADLTASPTLAAIDLDRRAAKRPLTMRDDGGSVHAEAFRSLRTALQYGGAGGLPRSVTIAGPVAEEGTTTITCNLAIALAESGVRVILVDADLRRPRVGDYLGIGEATGLTNVLSEEMAVKDVLRSWGSGSLSVLPSGPIPPNPSELLASRTFRATLRVLEGEADIVIFNAPPLLGVCDATILASNCAGAILVTRYGRTREDHVVQAAERLAAVNACLLGAVLNFVQPAGRASLTAGVPSPTAARRRVTAMGEGS